MMSLDNHLFVFSPIVQGEIETCRYSNVPEHIVLDTPLHGHRLTILVLDAGLATIPRNIRHFPSKFLVKLCRGFRICLASMCLVRWIRWGDVMTFGLILRLQLRAGASSVERCDSEAWSYGTRCNAPF